MNFSKMSDGQVSQFANALAKLISDLETGKDEPIEASSPTNSSGQTAEEIRAAAEIQNLRCRLTGYHQAFLRCGASQQLQIEIMQIKNSLMALGQVAQPFELMPSGWSENSSNPALELACRRSEQEALMRAEAPLEEQCRVMDRIRQLELMTGVPLR